jgi:concanavalin A-like lectin/glucanase superfamily protein
MRRFTVISVVSVLAAAGLVVVGPLAGPAAAAPTTRGLVLYYGFDGDTGTTVRDSSVSRINGTYVNTTAAAARSAGPPGKSLAARFVGTSKQYVSVPERNALDVDRFTLAAFVNYTGVQNPQTGGRWEVFEKANAYWINIRTDGHVRVGGFFGGCLNPNWQYLDSTTTIPTNTWTHVAATYNGSTLTVWINGQRAGNRSITGTHTCSNNRRLAIAAKNDPDQGLLEAFQDGQLDEVRIYNRVLSATEMQGLVS